MNRSRADRRQFMGGSEDSPVSRAKIMGVISSKHSSMASKPELAPNSENQGVQMWEGMTTQRGQVSATMRHEEPGVQAEDGPAVGAQVADGREPAVDLLDGLEVRREEQEVDLADLALLGIDEADLGREDEGDVRRVETATPLR